MTKEEFLNEPLKFYRSSDQPHIPDEWLSQAWEHDAHFRAEASYEFEREASKVGTLENMSADLSRLARVLPLARMIELFNGIRKRAFWREVEFRPAFERVLGKKIAAFPVPLAEEEIKVLMLEEVESALLSEATLSNWNREDENEAWSHLQPSM